MPTLTQKIRRLITKEDKAYGIIPIFKVRNKYLYFIVQHRARHWGFPKGHQNPGESALQTARRELKEETGLDGVKIIGQKYFFQKYSFKEKGVTISKRVKYFLGVCGNQETKIGKDEIRTARWAYFKEASRLFVLESNRNVLVEADKFLRTR